MSTAPEPRRARRSSRCTNCHDCRERVMTSFLRSFVVSRAESDRPFLRTHRGAGWPVRDDSRTSVARMRTPRRRVSPPGCDTAGAGKDGCSAARNCRHPDCPMPKVITRMGDRSTGSPEVWILRSLFLGPHRLDRQSRRPSLSFSGAVSISAPLLISDCRPNLFNPT
jgi:hypothetical protein